MWEKRTLVYENLVHDIKIYLIKLYNFNLKHVDMCRIFNEMQGKVIYDLAV